eukprot:3116237-Prymnesium_polylepis.1
MKRREEQEQNFAIIRRRLSQIEEKDAAREACERKWRAQSAAESRRASARLEEEIQQERVRTAPWKELQSTILSFARAVCHRLGESDPTSELAEFDVLWVITWFEASHCMGPLEHRTSQKLTFCTNHAFNMPTTPRYVWSWNPGADAAVKSLMLNFLRKRHTLYGHVWLRRAARAIMESSLDAQSLSHVLATQCRRVRRPAVLLAQW